MKTLLSESKHKARTEKQLCMAGAMSEAVPGSEPALPAPAAPLPSERRAESKPAKPSKPAARTAKPVEPPPVEFQTQEPFVPPPAKSKVRPAPPPPSLFPPLLRQREAQGECELLLDCATLWPVACLPCCPDQYLYIGRQCCIRHMSCSSRDGTSLKLHYPVIVQRR